MNTFVTKFGTQNITKCILLKMANFMDSKMLTVLKNLQKIKTYLSSDLGGIRMLGSISSYQQHFSQDYTALVILNNSLDISINSVWS